MVGVKAKLQLTSTSRTGLEMHPEKTWVVYCKDSKWMGTHEYVTFDFTWLYIPTKTYR